METDTKANIVFDQSASKKPKRFYFVKCWDNADPDENDLKIESMDKLIEKLEQERIQIQAKYQEKLSHWRPFNSQLQSLMSRDARIHSSQVWKTKKLDYLQSKLDELQFPKDSYQRGCISSKTSREHNVHTLHFLLLHGPNNLAAEKNLLREIERIKSRQSDTNLSPSFLEELNNKCFMHWTVYKEAKYEHVVEEMRQIEERNQKGMADAAAKGKTWNPMSLKRAKQNQIKLVKELGEEVRKEQWEVNAEIKRIKEFMKPLEKDMRVLRKQLREIYQKKDEARQCILNLRKQENDMNLSYSKRLLLIKKARELAQKRDIAALDELSHSQVDEFMLRWNSSRTFRICYEKGSCHRLRNMD